MLIAGVVALAVSVFYSSSALAFVGLGLTFWGALLLYIRPEEYTEKALLAALTPSLTTHVRAQMIQELGYKGDAMYLPPKYFTNPETTRVYISKSKRTRLLRRARAPKVIQRRENQPVAKTTWGILILPSGIQLSRLLEKSLGTSFIRTDLKNLQRKLPKLFIEDLEIAENLEIEAESDMTQRKEDHPASLTKTKSTRIHAKITKPLYGTTFKEAEEPSQIASSIGDPICSAIAIAFTKATGKLVKIVDTKTSEDGNTLEASYEIIED
jgi:hypothetical protein